MRTAAAVLWLVIPLMAAAGDAPANALKADKVVVLKKDRLLLLLNQGKEIKRYKVALGGDPVGPKTREGDHRTPEGSYLLDRRNAKSKFYKSIHVSYPTPEQIAAAKKAGVSPGGDVMIHGLPGGFSWLGSLHLRMDWTDGCIAVTNKEMDEIWALVADGRPIEIRP